MSLFSAMLETLKVAVIGPEGQGYLNTKTNLKKTNYFSFDLAPGMSITEASMSFPNFL